MRQAHRSGPTGPGPACGVQSGVSRIPPRRCAVIGAGVLGASVAARLAAAGAQVTLLEQDQPGRATSRWSLAWLNSNDKAPRPYHGDLQAAQEWARREATRIPPMTPWQVRQSALEARRADALPEP